MPPKSRLRESLGVITLIVYGLIVLLATMWPTPLDQGYSSSIDSLLAVLHRNGIPGWFGYGKLEFLANVAMFLPIGFLVSMLLPARAWWVSPIICIAASIGIEVTQSLFLSARFATLMDVVANTCGALAGALIAIAIRSAVYQRDQKVIARALWQASAARGN